MNADPRCTVCGHPIVFAGDHTPARHAHNLGWHARRQAAEYWADHPEAYGPFVTDEATHLDRLFSEIAGLEQLYVDDVRADIAVDASNIRHLRGQENEVVEP